MYSTMQAYLVVSGLIFGLVSIVHLVRAVNGWAFVVGPMELPNAVSWAAFVVTATLCYWAMRLAAGGV
jgi:hypothetical protein